MAKRKKAPKARKTGGPFRADAKPMEGPLKDRMEDFMATMGPKYAKDLFPANKLNEHFSVIEVFPFALQWILDSNGIFLGKVYMIQGDPSAGKSQFGYDLGAMFVDHGGLFVLIETENKTSQLTLTAKLGEDRMNSGQIFYHQTYSMDVDDKASDEDKLRAWQPVLRDWIDSCKKKLPDIPVFLLIDSMVGATSAETHREYVEDGYMQGRGYDGATAANSLKKFFSNLSPDIANTRITVAFTNHQKEGMAENNRVSREEGKRAPGGKSPNFYASTTLSFERGGPLRYANRGGRNVRITTLKQSYGSDDRTVEVPFYVEMQQDEDGNVLVDAVGNPIRHILWDWDEATANLLYNHCNRDGYLYTAAARDALDVERSNGKYSSKILGVSGVTASEFGQAVNENQDVYQELIKVQRLSINQYPTVYVPDGEAVGAVETAEEESADD